MRTKLVWVAIGAIITIAPIMSVIPLRVAQAADPDCMQSGSRTVCTFSYTGAAQTWTVPSDVTSATFDVYGASGGSAGGLSYPGYGGRATAILTVTPNTEITLMVGGAGDSVSKGQGGSCGPHIPSGGFNGGGDGGGGACPGSGGGGASDVRIGGAELSNRVIVAGGAVAQSTALNRPRAYASAGMAGEPLG